MSENFDIYEYIELLKEANKEYEPLTKIALEILRRNNVVVTVTKKLQLENFDKEEISELYTTKWSNKEGNYVDVCDLMATGDELTVCLIRRYIIITLIELLGHNKFGKLGVICDSLTDRKVLYYNAKEQKYFIAKIEILNKNNEEFIMKVSILE